MTDNDLFDTPYTDIENTNPAQRSATHKFYSLIFVK